MGVPSVILERGGAAVSAIFSLANAAPPTLVIVDDADTLEAHLAMQLGRAMEGAAEGVRVVAASSSLTGLHDSLRGGERIDAEVEIAAPTSGERSAMLGPAIAGMLSLEDGTSVEAAAQEVGRSAHGYVFGDLELVCAEASAGAAMDGRGRVGMADIRAALARVPPSALRDSVVEVPETRWSDVGGMDDVKRAMKEVVEWPLKEPEVFERLGVAPPAGVLLFGPPGRSKTLTARAIATEGGMNFLAVKGPEVLSQWLGDSEKRLAGVFRRGCQGPVP